MAAHHGTQVVVHDGRETFRIPVQNAIAAGKVAVGDWLVLNAADQRAIQLLERSSLLVRKAAGPEVDAQIIGANVDTAFIVSACTEDFNLSRIERYLAMTLQSEVTPVVVLTKADLADDPDELLRRTRELHPGLAVEVLDARDPAQAAVLAKWCGPGQSVTLLGSSGVGKSTLANALGADEQATGSVREDDGKGRHTTTARSLHLLPSGAVLVDNPGVRELQLPGGDEGVTDLFEDVVELIAACRFSDCAHASEPGCAIRDAIESGTLEERRYQNYVKLQEEQARHGASLAEKRSRDRGLSKMYRSAAKDKKRRRGGR